MSGKVFLAVCLVTSSLSAGKLCADELPRYEKGAQVTSHLASVGSDTMEHLMEAWADGFEKLHPASSLSIQAQGSGTAPAPLTAGESQLAPMSREMTDDEMASFEDKHGYKPLRVGVAFDAVAIYVHPDNPIRGISLRELDAIFSKDRKCGERRRIKEWGALVLGKLEEQPVKAYGRNDLSGTHDFFKETALCGGEFADSVTSLPSSEAVVDAVAKSPNAIGYSGIGYLRDDVRVIAVATGDTDDARYSTYYSEQFKDSKDLKRRYKPVLTGKYPLSRMLFIYVDKEPDKELSADVKEFLSFVLSKQGQEIVDEVGFIPLTGEIVDDQRAKLRADYQQPWWSRH